MRIYQNFIEAQSEVKRDLAEMGIRVESHTVQDKDVEGRSDYDALEIHNYDYSVVHPNPSDISGVSQPWARFEFRERIDTCIHNPGVAWEARREVWEEYLHEGKFAYTYSERMVGQVEFIINELIRRPNTRQAFLTIWDHADVLKLGGINRVPCTIGYHFLHRNGRLDITYHQRSCDWATHYANDVWLATFLLLWVAGETEMEPGTFTHILGSLHVFAKDMEGVF